MDNPSYFQSLQSPKSPQSPISHQSVVQGPPDLLYEDLYAAFKVDDSEARKHLDENLNILGTRLVSASESPSVKLMKKCSLRRLLSSAAGHKDREGLLSDQSKSPTHTKSWPPGLELKRSQSLMSQNETNKSEFIGERSKSFSLTRPKCWASSSSNLNSTSAMSHETNLLQEHIESTLSPHKRNSLGSVTLRRQHIAAADPMSTAVTTHHRPPLPPSGASRTSNSEERIVGVASRLPIATPSYGMKYKAVLRPHIPDVAIIYSANCQVSCEWMNFITNLMKNEGYKNVISQQLELFTDNNVILRNKETIPTAKAQIVILGQTFLDWIYTHPQSSIGSLFKDSTKVIGLLLGITKEHVKAEHRSELLTFAVWKFLLTIKANEHEILSQTLIRAVSSMMPNQSIPYVMPRPMRKFRVWPQPVQDQVLLLLNEKITVLDKIQITIDIFDEDDTPEAKFILENNQSDVNVLNELSIEVKMPKLCRGGAKVKFKLEINGLYWHPQNENPIVIKKDPIVDLDKYLSCYLNQFNAGAIEVQDDPKLPTFMHFAVKHEMKELIKTLLNLPGGTQMSTMVNNDGLNARDLAVQNGNLDLATILKDPKIPRQNYEFPVLQMKPETEKQVNPKTNLSNHYVNNMSLPKNTTEGQRQEIFNANNHEENPYLYDVPRKVENCYVVPPAPRPVEAANFKLRYVTMKQPTQIENGNSNILLPQSRQELLSSLRKSSSIEDLPEPEIQPPQPPPRPNFASVDNLEVATSEQNPPKSPLIDIVNPFPLTVPKTERKSSSPKDRLTNEFSQAQSQLFKGQITLAEAEMKFEEWKSSLMYTLVEEVDPGAVDQLTKQWKDILGQKDNVKNETNEKSLRKKFTKLIKIRDKKKGTITPENTKYSTLPSMPLRLKKARAISATSVNANPNQDSQSLQSSQIRNKSCSISETSRNSDSVSESSCSSAFEKTDNVSD